MTPKSRAKSRAAKFLEIARAAYSGWAAIIGTFIAGIALFNLTLNAFDMSVANALGWLLEAYRATFYPPIDFILSWLPFKIPATVKDVFVIYVAIGGVIYRSLSFGSAGGRFPGIKGAIAPSQAKVELYERDGDLHFTPLSRRNWAVKTLKTRLRVWRGVVLQALAWPIFLRLTLSTSLYVIRDKNGFRGRLPARDRAHAERFLKETGQDVEVVCSNRELIAVHSLTLVSAVLLLVVVNGAISDLGPRS
jgi:hypothetical protein